MFLGKEALLAWFSNVRSELHEDVLDRLRTLGRRRAAFTTSTYQLVEVFTKVRYDGSSDSVADLYDRLQRSDLRVLHGSDDWSDTRQSRTPKDVFEAATEVIENRPKMACNFPEAALVLALARENRNRDVAVFLFTFDGTLATLADTFDVPVLPYSTPLRYDVGR
ncbi:hypothetical protein [Halorussus halobius]|uniref:hypothetical protein n=1 Tax=Halorussus halobius TaxID=1710537 RepID=UPI001092AC2F|nr:hypothetical protein [Halorussus halobius]